MFVEEVMTREPVTVTAEARIKEALTRMASHGVTSLPVVDKMGRITGVVSEADLIRVSVEHDPRAQLNAVPSHGEQAVPGCVGDVMTPQAVTVREHSDLADAVDLMTSAGFKSLPVVDEHQHVIGVVSRSDVVKQLARADADIEAEVDTMMVALGQTKWLVEVHEGRVDITGPATDRDRSLARVSALSVRGVVNVHTS